MKIWAYPGNIRKDGRTQNSYKYEENDRSDCNTYTYTHVLICWFCFHCSCGVQKISSICSVWSSKIYTFLFYEKLYSPNCNRTRRELNKKGKIIYIYGTNTISPIVSLFSAVRVKFSLSHLLFQEYLFRTQNYLLCRCTSVLRPISKVTCDLFIVVNTFNHNHSNNHNRTQQPRHCWQPHHSVFIMDYFITVI